MRQLTKAELWRSTSGAATALGLCLLLALPAGAQTGTWTLRISDGVVSVNGRAISADKLPASLDTRQHLQMEWSDDEAPVIAFGDRSYVLESHGLRELTPVEIERYGLPSVSISGVGYYVSEPSAANQQLVNQLSEVVADLDRGDVKTNSAIREGVEQAARTAAALPHLELQSYWYGLKQSDQQLFEDMLREQVLNQQANDLARTILVLPTGERRQKLEVELRRLLNDSFDLMQMNRAGEIEQLENRLTELQRKLAERNAKREQIIARRYKDLIGSSY